jgi:hypothetical protein
MTKIRNRRLLLIGTLAGAIVLGSWAIWWFLDSTRPTDLARKPEMSSAIGSGDAKIPNGITEEDSNDLQTNEIPQVDTNPDLGAWQAYDEVVLDVYGIDEYILEQLELAEAGNADSAHYVSEAMHHCATDMLSLQQSYDFYANDQGSTAADAEQMINVVMDALTGHQEFYLQQVQHSLERALECEKLGWTPQYLYEESVAWNVEAVGRGQVVAMAKLARLDPLDPPTDASEIERSRAIIREVLGISKELHVLLHASAVISASTGKDFEFERLSWALVACEYDTCGRLNHLYTSACENMSLQGSSVCTRGMTDLDYLFRKYPEKFDAARSRAQEIKQAIEREDWQSIGLQSNR